MEPFKNLLGVTAAQKIARAIKNHYEPFNTNRFLKKIEENLEPLELKARMIYLQSKLAEQIAPHPKSFHILVSALKKNETDLVGLSGFLVWPLTHFVAEHGLGDFKKSMTALKEMTKVFTAEFAVRPFF